MTAVSVDEMHVEIKDCRNGTVTLTTLPTGFEILGVHRSFRTGDKPTTFRATVEFCDCRFNPESKRRCGWPVTGTRGCACDSQRHQAMFCGHHANLGTRPLCPKDVRHNATCHQKMDHCVSRWHSQDAQGRIRKMFDAVVATYR